MQRPRDDTTPPGDEAARSAAADDATVISDGAAETVIVDARFTAAPAEGDLLAGRYRIEAFLARGGMGDVYRARDLELGVIVALKTIRDGIASDPEALRAFKQEVLLARSVTHPNVCRIFDLGRHQDERGSVAFLTMEYLEGRTLAARIAAEGALAPAAALSLMRQVARALDAAHDAGIVHRDLKSSNIMLVGEPGDERAVITDFGLAIAAEETRLQPREGSVSAICGTPAYMAPEQVRGDRVGAPADRYALGVVLFEAITSELPFAGATQSEMMLSRLTQDPRPHVAFTRLAPVWETVTRRLMARAPEDRFASAREAVAVLEGAPGPTAGARHSLPAERDSFVGRTRELGAIDREFDGGARLVSLLGPGGTGKTRLARRYATTRLPRWPGGIWFVDLTEVRDLPGVALAVANGLEISLGEGDAVDQLGRRLKELGRALLLVDNCEQVVTVAEQAVGRWLERAPELQVLATSRERLQAASEHVLVVEPLQLTEEAVALFEQRAQAQRPEFRADGDGRPIVLEIVRLLDGLPLAIELAAARLRALSLEQLRDRLGDRFRVLRGSGRGRHETLQHTLDWSWDLLRPWEQSALVQASVFEGGFTLEAAEEVLDLSAWPEGDYVLDVVQALLDKSWLHTHAGDERPRFRMYSSLHAYAAVKLRQWNEPGAGSIDTLDARHGSYFARLGSAEAMRALGRQQTASTFRALRGELENVAAACRRAVARGDGETATATLAAAWTVLELCGPYVLGVEMGEAVLRVESLTPLQRARALRCLGAAFGTVGRNEESVALLLEALALQRTLGNRRQEGLLRNQVGTRYWALGEMEEARAQYEASIEIAREVGNRSGEGASFNNLGLLFAGLGNWSEAREAYLHALAAHLEVGDRKSEAILLSNLANAHRAAGDLASTERALEGALQVAREIGYRSQEGVILGAIGSLRADQGRLEEARGWMIQAIEVLRGIGEALAEADVLSGLALIEARAGRLDEAGAAVNRGESLLKNLPVGRELCRLLVSRGEVERMAGRRRAALDAAETAETIAGRLHGGVGAELRGAIEELRRALGSA